MKKKRPEFPSDVKRKVIERSSNKCERCGIDFDEDYTGEFHHIISSIYGGDNSIDNCTLLCHNCHRAAPNIKNLKEMLIYRHYFLRFASFKEAAQHYKVDNRLDLSVKIAFDIAKLIKK